MIDAHLRESIRNDYSRRALAQVVTLLLDCWEVPLPQQAALLGLRLPAQLSACRASDPLPAFGKSIERAASLIGIDRALGLIFPTDPDSRYGWVSRPHPFFDRAPLSVMLSGFVGIKRVERVIAQMLN